MSEEIKHRPAMTGSAPTSGFRLARLADAIDLLEADVAAIQAKVGQVAPEHVRHFVEQRDAAIRERDGVSRKLDEARALLELAQVQRTAAYADRDEARAEVYRLKCSMTETSKDRDAAIRERDQWREEARLAVINRDEARAEVEKLKESRDVANRLFGAEQAKVERLRKELEQRQPAGNSPKTSESSPAAPQPAAPPAGWLTTEERGVIVCAASELSAIGHHRPPDKEQCLRLSAALRSVVKRHDEGSPPVVEVPKMSDLSVAARVEAQCYRDALDKAGVAWKEVGRE